MNETAIRAVNRSPARQGTFGPVDCFLGLAILSLSLLDVLWTLLHVMEDGRELNPLMSLALELGYAPFGAIKMGSTALGVLGLMAFASARRLRLALTSVFILYLCVTLYHLYLRFVLGA